MDRFEENLYVFAEFTVGDDSSVEKKPVWVGRVVVEYDSEYVNEKQIKGIFRQERRLDLKD